MTISQQLRKQKTPILNSNQRKEVLSFQIQGPNILLNSQVSLNKMEKTKVINLN